MSMLSNLDLIRRVPLFSMLTNDQAQQVADSVVKRGMELFRDKVRPKVAVL